MDYVRKYFTLAYNQWWFKPLVIFIIWRVGLELIALLAFNTGGHPISAWPAILEPPLWARWDSGWYNDIVHHNYVSRLNSMGNTTFFPLFPLLWYIVEKILQTPPMVAGLIVANTMTLASFLTLWRWLYKKYGDTTAFQSLLALAFFPTSFFLISAYSESTLLFLSILTFKYLDENKFTQAGLVAGLASAARPIGILLWPVFAWYWWRSLTGTITHKIFNLKNLILILPALGVLFFSLYLWQHTGSPLIWLTAQSQAGREFINPLKLLGSYVLNIINLGSLWPRHLAELTSLIFLVILLPKMWQLNKIYVLFAGLNLLPSLLSGTLVSLPRFVLIIVPLFIVLGQIKNTKLYYAYLSGALLLLFISINQFINWNWAG